MIDDVALSQDGTTEVLRRLGVSRLNNLVEEALGEDAACIEGFSAGSLSDEQGARCLVSLYGRNILTVRSIRASIADTAHSEDLDLAFSEYLRSEKTLRDAASFNKFDKVQRIAAKAWHPGTSWPRAFCDYFRLPRTLAGTSTAVTIPELEQVDPFIPLNELHDFQKDLRDKVLNLLHLEADSRALIALPTGAGKTRLMVETVLGLPEVENGTKSIMWVAQHNELCEQAVQCFAQVWSATERPRRRRLSIQRVWKGLSDELDWSADVFIGTPASLIPRLGRSSQVERASITATILDEAHHAIAKSYEPLFELASSAAIFGITATPGSSSEGGAARLKRRFRNRVLVADQLGPEPVKTLQRMGILAIPEPETIITSEKLSFGEVNLESFGDVSPAALQRLGANGRRNRLIIDRLLKTDDLTSVLCFAPSVRSARAIASALAMNGRFARSIDSESDIHFRNETIADFRAGRVQFLVNYGVLSSGFDAPRVDCLVLARPTTSPVLFEQMLGRGLRGPANGGTATCTIVHFEDDFSGFGGIKPMSYARFLDWTRS